MGLDAFVYCDCFERDNLRCNPPAGVKVEVAPTGELACRTSDEKAWHAFSAWKRAKACPHEGMILIHHRLGSTSHIDNLRVGLQKQSGRFPIILHRILYCGSHTCDWIAFHQIPALTEELKHLNPQPSDPVADPLRLFKIQMAELVIAAQMTRKPICF
jgi:hypothetical protein